MPTTPGDEPAAQAHALVERLFALLHDCGTAVRQLEAARTNPEPSLARRSVRGKSLRGPEGITG